MDNFLTQKVVTKRITVDGTNYTGAAGVTALTSTPVDTAGFEGLRFIIGFGAIVSGAVTSIKARQGALANMSDGADLAGTSQTIADDDDNKVAIVEIRQPQERYVDLVTTRGTQNATVDFLLVELFGVRKEPVTQDTSVISAEIHASPDEGTA